MNNSKWENIDKMFPTGEVPFYGTPIDEIGDEVKMVSYRRTSMARDMIIEQTQEEFTREGEHHSVSIYSVYPETKIIGGIHCLNVFGQKMINNKREEIEGGCASDDGFNYTGI